MLRILVVFCCLLLSAKIFALDYSERMSILQGLLGEAQPSRGVVIMDRMELSSILKPQVSEDHPDTESIEEYNFSVVQKYVQDKTKLEISKIDADILYSYYLSGGRVAIPVHDYKLCGVMTSPLEVSSVQEIQRMLFWDKVGKLPEFEGKKIESYLDGEDAALFSDLHELFHCLDEYYFDKMVNMVGENEEMIHRSEAFAEISALIYLVQSQKWSKEQIDLRVATRILSSYIQGRYKSHLGVSLSQVNYGGVYSFQRVMREAFSFIKDQSRPLKLLEILEASHELVEKYALNSAEFFAVVGYQKDPEALDSMIEKLQFDNSPYIAERFQAVSNMRDIYLSELDWSVDQLLSGLVSQNIANFGLEQE